MSMIFETSQVMGPVLPCVAHILLHSTLLYTFHYISAGHYSILICYLASI